MHRVDLFTTVHKGLRTALFETAQRVARTDFNTVDSTERAAAEVRRLIAHLDEHSQHEDRVILPEVERLGAAVHAELYGDHNRVGGLQREIEGILDRLSRAGDEERLSLGQRLHEKMGRLVAEHLLHMEREETTANRLLWAHRSDEELMALHGAILGAIPPARMRQWAEIIVPSVNSAERGALLAGLRRTLPEEEVSRIAALAGDDRSGDGASVTSALSMR